MTQGLPDSKADRTRCGSSVPTEDRRADAQTEVARTAEAAINRTLDLIERRRLAAAELRILLALLDGEGADSELAEAFGRPSEEIRRAAERLCGRSWRAGSTAPVRMHESHHHRSPERRSEHVRQSQRVGRPLRAVHADDDWGVLRNLDGGDPRTSAERRTGSSARPELAASRP
jgi:hypothetical protein